ncbi:hypothetical protein [Anoxybacillus flavithermus]|uniref:Uncharacterized protein n=1 Tax=Anoxybacillus flavithermus TaxID=33934 RepID=A0A178TBV5_9BACL|nr:hypothetical protein [Anoxybacillus flavithermus]OAO78594.1 hypothetical protein TAF16_1861 [Anoxybacillus flavithermus]
MIDKLQVDGMNISFSEQVWILRKEVSKVFEYMAIDDFYHAKNAVLNDDWNPENIAEVLMRANYNGAIARITYYKYIHKLGFDPRALWDALILEWMMSGVWIFALDKAINTKEFRDVLKKFRYPEWVKFGLTGGGLDELKKMGEKFSVEMDRIKESI